MTIPPDLMKRIETSMYMYLSANDGNAYYHANAKDIYMEAARAMYAELAPELERLKSKYERAIKALNEIWDFDADELNPLRDAWQMATIAEEALMELHRIIEDDKLRGNDE